MTAKTMGGTAPAAKTDPMFDNVEHTEGYQVFSGPSKQPTDSRRSYLRYPEVRVGDWITVPARPEWGTIEVIDVSDAGVVSARISSHSSAPIVRVGRAAIKLQEQATVVSEDRDQYSSVLNGSLPQQQAIHKSSIVPADVSNVLSSKDSCPKIATPAASVFSKPTQQPETGQLSDPEPIVQADNFPHEDIIVGDRVYVASRPEWGAVEVMAASNPEILLVRVSNDTGVSIKQVNRTVILRQPVSVAAPETRQAPELEAGARSDDNKPSDVQLGAPHEPASAKTPATSTHQVKALTTVSSPSQPTLSHPSAFGYLIQDVRSAAVNSANLTAVLTRVESFPCSTRWNDEVSLAHVLSTNCGEAAKRLAIARLENAYRLAKGVLPDTIRSGDAYRREVLDRCDIACRIGRLALEGLTQRDLREHPDLVETGLRYLHNVIVAAEIYYPALHLYVSTLFKQKQWAQAAKMGQQLHERASAFYPKTPYDRWYWEYRIPRMVADRCLRALGQPVVQVRQPERPAGVTRQAEQNGLDKNGEDGHGFPSRNADQHALNSQAKINRVGRPRSSLVERLEVILREQGEPTHYSVLVDIYNERHETISARDLCGVLNANKQVFREVESGTFGLPEQASQENHWLLDFLAEVAKDGSVQQ